jgi:serine/threonine-protein kinase
VLRQIPAADLTFVRRARIDTLIPVITPDDQLHAFLALGPKRSEEPYAQEDYGVLVAIAENLALLVARSAPRPEPPLLEECPECGACFDGGARVCSHHERALVPRGLPRTLAGRYRLEQRLAAGGMGTVYKALDMALERYVAAKVVRENLAASDGALSRFVEEAKLAARLREHPHIVTLYDFGIIDGHQPFMIMELLVGRTLRHVLGTPGGLSPRRTHEILEGVCSAVSAAHRRGLVHRDLKPENIFLADIEHGTVAKVLDFGIAKPVSVVTTMTYRRDTDPMVLLGTLEYMSPEQRRGEAPSVAWDLWSLAVIALEMLSDRPPASALLPDVAPWQPGAVLKDTLPTCVEVFNRAMSLNPAERPADADALLLELTRALDEGNILPPRRGRRDAGVFMWN